MNKEEKQRICLITSPRIKASYTPLSNLINILSSISEELYVLTGNVDPDSLNLINSVPITSIKTKKHQISILSIPYYIYINLKYSYHIIKKANQTDLYFFFLAECFILPIIAAKFSRKPVVLLLGSNAIETINITKNGMIINEIAKLVEKINYNLVDYIVVYSKRLIYDWKLEKHMSKILVAHEHILNFDQFKIETPIIEREYVIGFIGRFTETKGIINFIESVPISLSYNSNLKFVVVGDGPLYDDIIKYLREKNIDQEVSLKGWVSHDELPKLLNSLKVLVVPSYSEGLPNVLLEAMACGTIVLSTQVGAISDVIVDSNTGFLMNNNSPETIAREICRLLSCPNLDEISNNAYFKVSREFRYGSKIKMFKKLINSVRK